MNAPTLPAFVRRPRWSAFAVLAMLAGWTVWPQAVVQQGNTAAPKRQRINTIIQRLEEGGVADSSVKIFIDREHQPFDINEVKKQFDEIATRRKPNGQLEKTPVVRLPTRGEDTTWMVEQVLDVGGLAITFPLMETKAQVMKAINTMRITQKRGSKYPNPPGVRGAGMWTVETFTGFPLWGKMGPDEYMERADLWPLNPNGELFAVIMVETPLGIKNINDILTVPGIGAIVVGTNDLSIALGIGRATRPETELPPEAIEGIMQVAKACTTKGVYWGISVPGTEKFRQEIYTKLGARYPLS
jgi:4-hydroxy-2-oxoheptanedioate aldolase